MDFHLGEYMRIYVTLQLKKSRGTNALQKRFPSFARVTVCVMDKHHVEYLMQDRDDA